MGRQYDENNQCITQVQAEQNPPEVKLPRGFETCRCKSRLKLGRGLARCMYEGCIPCTRQFPVRDNTYCEPEPRETDYAGRV